MQPKYRLSIRGKPRQTAKMAGESTVIAEKGANQHVSILDLGPNLRSEAEDRGNKKKFTMKEK